MTDELLDLIQYVGDGRTPATVAEMLLQRADMTPAADFVTCGGTRITFGQAAERANDAASALASIGVRKGDRVAVMLPNCLEFLDLWFGSALLGAVLVPVNTALRGDGLRYVIDHSTPKVVVADAALVEHVEHARAQRPSGERRLVLGSQHPGWEGLTDLLNGAHPRRPCPRIAPSDLASILYTSGTTGLPKGVMNCHNAYCVTAHQFARTYVRMRVTDVLYTSLPLFHVNAQMLTTMGAIVSGRSMILAKRFSASGFVDEVTEHGATVFNYIGAMLSMIYAQPATPGDGHTALRLAVGGAAPEALWQLVERRFGLTVLEIYGLTETATFCVGSPPHDVRVGRIGRAVSWADVDVQRSDGTRAADEEPGEIAVRANADDILFKGYFRNASATRQAFRNGWFLTGDLGARDADGYLRFLDRLKDSIRRRGENISSFEVEQVVNQHPAVSESAALGVPSELGEEDVAVVVVLEREAKLEPGDLIRFCESRMAAFMVPRYVQLADSLPKTETQRIQKYALRGSIVGTAWDREAGSPWLKPPRGGPRHTP